MLDEAMQCPVDELEAQIVDVRRRHRRCEFELACLLVAWDQRECARSRGDTDTGGWAVRVLGLSRRETAELLRIGRRLPDLPHVRGAFEDGQLGWTQVREIVRVAEPETDEAWTARAQEVSSRRLEREVAACRRGDAPPDFEDMELPSRVLLRFDVATGDAMVIRKALAVLRAEAGDQGEVDDGVLLATLARTSLRDGDSPERPMPEERYRVVIEECPTCRRVTHVGQADGVHRVDPAVAEEAACDHERVDSAGRLSHAIPPKARRRVLHRDGYRCTVPHCGADLWVDVHHIQARVDGGRHDDLNLSVRCTGHHRAVHEDRLRVWRDDSGVIRAETMADVPPVDGAPVDALLDVLSFTVLDSGEVAKCMGLRDDEARRLLGWLERRREIVATPGGGWHRLAA